MRNNLFITFFVLFLFISGMNQHAFSQGSDDTAYRFLKLASSPRAAALGGNHVALPSADISFFHMNPGYLSSKMHRNFAISYVNHIGDLNMGFANGAWKIRDIGILGVGVRYMNYGTFERRDANGIQNGEFTASDLAFTAGLGREIAENLNLGITATFVHASYAEFSSSALAFNAGIRYTFTDLGLDAGLSITNVGFQLSEFDNTSEKLPVDVRVGVSRRLEYIPLRFSITAHSLNRWEIDTQNDTQEPSFTGYLFRHLLFGAELSLSENVHLRAGYDHLQHQELKINNRLDTAGFGYGFGIRYRGITFDFSRNSFSEMGGVTRIGIQTYL